MFVVICCIFILLSRESDGGSIFYLNPHRLGVDGALILSATLLMPLERTKPTLLITVGLPIAKCNIIKRCKRSCSRHVKTTRVRIKPGLYDQSCHAIRCFSCNNTLVMHFF